MKIYKLYHKNREYALMQGDPLLQVVESESKEEAENDFSHLGITGVLAINVNICPECKRNEVPEGEFVCVYCNNEPTCLEIATGIHY